MVKNSANIDVVFRNGLKDFEVLPPPEVWNNIHPALIKKQRASILLRVAALITVVLTMSFLAYRFTRDISTDLDNSVMALNQDPVSPEFYSEIISPAVTTSERYINITTSPVVQVEPSQDSSDTYIDERNTSAETAFIQQTNSLSIGETYSVSRPEMETLQSSLDNSIVKYDFGESLLQGNDNFTVTDRWSVAAMASPTYYSNFSSGNNELAKQLGSSEQAVISYTGGVAFSYKVNKRFSVQSGLFYSSVGQEVDGISSFGGFKQYDYTKGDRNFEVLTRSGTIYTSNADVFLVAEGPGERILTNYTNDVFDPNKASLEYINSNLRQNFSYIELPIILRYKFVDKMIDFNLIGGISYNMLVNNSVYTMNEGGKYFIGKTDGLNMITVSSSFGMGMEYNLSGKLSLNLEPTFRYYLNPFNHLEGSSIHPYSFGVFSGISYKF